MAIDFLHPLLRLSLDSLHTFYTLSSSVLASRPSAIHPRSSIEPSSIQHGFRLGCPIYPNPDLTISNRPNRSISIPNLPKADNCLYEVCIFEPGIAARVNVLVLVLAAPGHHNQPVLGSRMTRDIARSKVFILAASDYHLRGMPMPKIRIGIIVNWVLIKVLKA